MIRLLSCILLGALLCVGTLSCVYQQKRAPIETSAIANLHRLTDRLYSGGEPTGETAYHQLATLGIQTVISVDAVAPDKALADQHGIRVIHLPIGYDGVPEHRATALSKAIATIDGPIYLHCHHGKHRAPAALAVGAIGAGEITREQGRAHLARAGTSADYPGLWESVQNALPASRDQLKDDSIELPVKSEVGDFSSAMSAIDRAHEELWICADNGFIAPSDHPDLAPASLAGQIHNTLRFLRTDPLVEDEGGLFAMLLEESTRLASSVETAINTGDHNDAMEKLVRLGDSCVDCHSRFRD